MEKRWWRRRSDKIRQQMDLKRVETKTYDEYLKIKIDGVTIMEVFNNKID